MVYRGGTGYGTEEAIRSVCGTSTIVGMECGYCPTVDVLLDMGHLSSACGFHSIFFPIQGIDNSGPMCTFV